MANPQKKRQHPGRGSGGHTRSPLEEKQIALTRELQRHEKAVKESFEKFTADVIVKVNGLAKMVGGQQAQLSILAASGEGIDRNVLAMAEMMKEVFGQLTMIDEMLKALEFTRDNKPLEDLVDSDLVKTTALAWYRDVLKSSFELVDKKLKDHQEAQAAAEAEKARAAAAPAELQVSVDQQERESMEEELAGASPIALSAPTKVEPHIPEGTQIFGG